MIFVCVQRLNPERRILLDRGVEAFLEFFQDVGFEKLSSGLGAPDDVVLVLVGGMIEMLNPHGTSLAYSVCEVQGSIHPRTPVALCDGAPCVRGFLV